MAEDSNHRKAGKIHDSADHDDARTGGIDSNDKIVSKSRHRQAIPPKSLQRAASCDSIFQNGGRRQPQSSLSPLVSWDDTGLINRHHVALMCYVEDFVSIHQPGAAIRENQRKTTLSGAALEGKKNPRQTDQIQMDKTMADQAQMGAAEMGVIIRRTQNINAFDGPRAKKHSDAEQFPGYSSPAKSDSEVNFTENRLLHPNEYFRELDDLGSEVFKKSMFHFYTVSCNS